MALQRLGWTACICALLLALSSCGYVSTSSLELLQAPVLNQRQAELQDALGQTLNVADIVYCYPLTGEYLAPFIFVDMDGDGLEEAIVLYAFSDDPDAVRIRALRQSEEGGWETLYDIGTKGEQVEFIQFSHLLSRDALCLIVGWRSGGSAPNRLEIYSLSDGEFLPQLSEDAYGHAIDDFDGGGLSRVMLVTSARSGEGFQLVMLRGSRGRIQPLDTIPLEPEARSVLQMLQGTLWDGSTAMYIDLEQDYGTVSTEVIGVGREALLPVACSQSEEDSAGLSSYTSSFRGDRVLCVDLYGDGVIEVPRMVELPRPVSSYDTDEGRALELTEYRNLTAEGYETVYHAAVNSPDGYLVFFPERWVGEVTVVTRPETREWQFYRVDSNTREPAVELFRVFVYVTGDYRDRFTETYTLLGTKGLLQYYGHLPADMGEEPLALTPAEAQEAFLLL